MQKIVLCNRPLTSRCIQCAGVLAAVINDSAIHVKAVFAGNHTLFRQTPALVAQRAEADIDHTLVRAIAFAIQRTRLRPHLINLLLGLLFHRRFAVQIRLLRRQYRESKPPDRLA